jgi:hypothetical protein
MTALGLASSNASQKIVAGRIQVAVFTAALFLSAALLFGIQPMFTKMVLPRLGGSPSVWSVAMVFFQTALLAGYLYAHLSTRYLRFGWAVSVHLCLLALAFVSLPISVAVSFGRPPEDGQAMWLIGLLAVSVGLPFFALAGNAPLLQAWFARSGHPNARNPYFLYRASNIGSLASLLAYPLLLEPTLTLHQQSHLWTYGFTSMAILLAGCGALVWGGAEIGAECPLAPTTPAPGMHARILWTLLSFVPSALLVAVTAHIGTEIISAPYLWVIPLVLFLLSFVIVFRDHEIVSRRLLLRMQVGLTVALAFSFILARWTPTLIAVPLHLSAYFVAALLCHGALYTRRPDAAHLTGFYLCMSFGGALGGIFAALIAPHLFATVAEYPILIVAGLIPRPHLLDAPLSAWKSEATPVLVLGLVLLAPAAVFGGGLEGHASLFFLVALVGLAAAFVWQSEHPVRMLAFAALMFALTQFYELGLSHVVYARSFFGVHKIVDFAGGRARLLFHGATVHGAERLMANDGAPVAGRPEQLTYYYQGGPFEEAIDAARAAGGGRLPRVALVGLGVGALACSRATGESWSLYEIDPELVRISTQSGLFRTMPTCAPDIKVILGDARLTLTDAREPFDLMILDAYSSDNIPVHLLTQEAMQLYESLLAPHGKIVMNITNRNMDLTDIVASSAHAVGLAVRDKRDRSSPDFKTTFHAAAHIAVLARDEKDFGALVPENGWRPAAADPSFRTWTDDYSNVLGAILKRPSP